MSEEAGAAAGATTDAGAAAPATGATAAPPSQGAGAAAVSAAPAPQWFDGLDKDTRGYIENKQWFGPDLAKADLGKSVSEIVKSYRGMESIMGRNRVAVPKDPADEEGWNAYYAAGGRPGSWQDYGFKAGEGDDQKIADSYAQIAFKHGLSTKQTQGLAADWQTMANDLNAAAREAAEAQFMSTSQSDLNTLRNEWGHDANAKFAAAQRAGVALGFDKEKMNKLERALGTKDFVTMMANMGASISEDRGSGAGTGTAGGGPNTPEGARARMAELKGDKIWLEKYLAGGASEVAEWSRLENILANSMAA